MSYPQVKMNHVSYVTEGMNSYSVPEETVRRFFSLRLFTIFVMKLEGL